MAKCIGIAFGNANSTATITTDTGEIRIIPNSENEYLTMSVVSFYKNKKGHGQILVGRPAINRMDRVPKDTIISIKRLLGQSYSNPEVQNAKARFPYEIESPIDETAKDMRIESPIDETAKDMRVVMGGRRYSPSEILSIIFRKIKKDAEAFLNDKVEWAVITVPAYFTELQKDATLNAGLLAGLKIKKILDEPTAAAIAYGFNNLSFEKTQNILVYDMGGGTFDVCILNIKGGNITHLAAAGNTWLGGDDFDKKIVDYAINNTEKVYGIDIKNIDEQKKLSIMIKLKKEAEKAKQTLSSNSKAEIKLIVEDKEQNLIDVQVEITREQFEEMIEDNIKTSIEIVNQAIKNINLNNEEIDYIILTGGSSLIPMVQRAINGVFSEEKVLKHIDPITCVAQGAGLLAGMLNEVECPNCKTLNPIDKDKCIKCDQSLIVKTFETEKSKYVKKELIDSGAFSNVYLVINFNTSHQYALSLSKRFMAPFKLTEQSYNKLEKNGLPEVLFMGLKSIENQLYTDEKDFVKAIEKAIGSEETVKYKSLILKSARFIHEESLYSTLEKIDHKNLVSVKEKGFSKDGFFYTVMENLKDMIPIDQYVRQLDKPLDSKIVVKIGSQICQALNVLHEKGIVHGDLHPNNILISEEDISVKLIDYGLTHSEGTYRESNDDEIKTTIGFLKDSDYLARVSKPMKEEMFSHAKLHNNFQFVGRLGYIAPELKFGVHNVDRRSDIYSLGCVLYYMLTSRTPIGLFERPSNIRQDIPEQWDRIIQKCITYNPKERYQSTTQVDTGLRELFKIVPYEIVTKPFVTEYATTASLLALNIGWIISNKPLVGAMSFMLFAILFIFGLRLLYHFQTQ